MYINMYRYDEIIKYTFNHDIMIWQFLYNEFNNIYIIRIGMIIINFKIIED